jgi:hypothetical protein
MVKISFSGLLVTLNAYYTCFTSNPQGYIDFIKHMWYYRVMNPNYPRNDSLDNYAAQQRALVTEGHIGHGGTTLAVLSVLGVALGAGYIGSHRLAREPAPTNLPAPNAVIWELPVCPTPEHNDIFYIESDEDRSNMSTASNSSPREADLAIGGTINPTETPHPSCAP